MLHRSERSVSPCADAPRLVSVPTAGSVAEGDVLLSCCFSSDSDIAKSLHSGGEHTTPTTGEYVSLQEETGKVKPSKIKEARI